MPWLCVCLPCHLIRLDFHNSIFFSHTTWQIWTKLCRNVTWVGLNIIYDLCCIRKCRLATMTIMPSDWLKFQISENFYQLEIQDGHHHMTKFELMERIFFLIFCETTEPFWMETWLECSLNGLLQKSKRVVIAEHSFDI